MGFYKNKDTRKITGGDIAKGVLFILLLVAGLILCPKENLYSINQSNMKNYSIGIFLTSLSIVYFFASLALSSAYQGIIMRVMTAALLIICGIVSITFIGMGGINAAIGISIFCGVSIGAILAFII